MYQPTTPFKRNLPGAWLFLALFVVPVAATAQPCPSTPRVDLGDRPAPRTLIVSIFNRDPNVTEWDSHEVRPGDPPRVKFNENPICFLYRVGSGTRTREGALVVTVVRKYTQPDENSGLVYLYRGEGFFDQDGLEKEPQEYDRRYTFDFYDEFHDVQRPLPDPDFERDFHAYWSKTDDSSTAQPFSKRSAFRYGERADNELRRTYLLHYSTSREGSWIPFKVEPYRPQSLKSLKVTLWDFGETTEESILKDYEVTR